MEILKLEQDFGTTVMRASGALRSGGVILYPTDTLYGLGADALSEEAIEKIYAIKGREARKPLHSVVADLDMAAEYAEVNDAARRIAGKFLPGPLTLILKKRADADPAISKERMEFAIRIPDNRFCLELARTFGKPFTTTSANVSGAEPEMTIEKILAQFGDSASGIDIAIDAGPAPLSRPSTVVNLVSGHPSILREGAIPGADILALF